MNSHQNVSCAVSKASKGFKASKASTSKAVKVPAPNMDDWTVEQLKDYLREQKGRHSNMNRASLLELAKLYKKKPKEDPKIAVAYEEHFAEILQKRKLFETADILDRTNISSFDLILPKSFEFDKVMVNSFLTCCDIEIEEEVVDTGIIQPAKKAQCSKLYRISPPCKWAQFFWSFYFHICYLDLL